MTHPPESNAVDYCGLPMSAIKVGMRLRRSFGDLDPRFDMTVTELTDKGFKYTLDADVHGWPRAGSYACKGGGEHYGLDGWSMLVETKESNAVDDFTTGTVGIEGQEYADLLNELERTKSDRDAAIRRAEAAVLLSRILLLMRSVRRANPM